MHHGEVTDDADLLPCESPTHTSHPVKEHLLDRFGSNVQAHLPRAGVTQDPSTRVSKGPLHAECMKNDRRIHEEWGHESPAVRVMSASWTASISSHVSAGPSSGG